MSRPRQAPEIIADYLCLFAVTAGRGVDKKERQFIADHDDTRPSCSRRLPTGLPMTPAASVSGFYLAHPDAAYCNVGRIGDDQIADWARRMEMEEGQARRGLASVV